MYFLHAIRNNVFRLRRKKDDKGEMDEQERTKIYEPSFIRIYIYICISSIRFNRNIPALIYNIARTHERNMINAFICFGFPHELASFQMAWDNKYKTSNSSIAVRV